jgi:hypothetical protein
MHFALKLYRNWPGEVSVREHEASLHGLKPHLIGDSIAALADLTGRVPLQIYVGHQSARSTAEFSFQPSETKAWHTWVARVLQLSSSQFHIDELKDWFPDKQLFISSYGPKGTTIGVLACQQRPNQVAIDDAIEFIRGQASTPARLIVAISDEVGERSSESTRSVEIEYRYRNEMLSSLVDFSTYRSDIKFRYETAEISEGYPYRMPDVYVPSSGFIRHDHAPQQITDVEDFIISWVHDKGLKHLAILGEYGQGKSVLALRLAYRLMFLQDEERLPILITLGGRSPRTETKLSIMAQWAATYDINPRALLALHEAGRLLLIFDGFDEMDLVGDAKLRLDHFRSLWQFSADRGSKIIITGRPNFFLDQLERERSLNIRQRSIDVPYTQAVYISPFSFSQIRDALRSFSPDVRDEILAAARSEEAPSSFRELISRPSTLFLAANILGQIRQDQPTRVRSAEIIGRFISHSYERQQRKSQQPFLSMLEREYFTVGIAEAMYGETRFSNHISKAGFQQAIVRLLDGFPKDLSRFDQVTDRPSMFLKERLQDREMLLETISTDVRSCGVIVTDLAQSDHFKFAHKSFFELIRASHFVFRWAEIGVSGELVLHHAVDVVFVSDRSESMMLSFIRPWALTAGGLNREMVEFAAEILYRLSGVTSSMGADDLERRLVDLGVPVRPLERVASIRSQGDVGFFSFIMFSYPLIFAVVLARRPLVFLLILACVFRLHGKGGEKFVRYHDHLLADVDDPTTPPERPQPT